MSTTAVRVAWRGAMLTYSDSRLLAVCEILSEGTCCCQGILHQGREKWWRKRTRRKMSDCRNKRN